MKGMLCMVIVYRLKNYMTDFDKIISKIILRNTREIWSVL